MNVDHIHERIIALKKEPLDNHFQRLFDLFMDIEKALEDCGTSEVPVLEAKSVGLIEAQTTIIRTAVSFPALTSRDVLFKLAFWRRFGADLHGPKDKWPCAEAIAYSAFRDLARIIEETGVLTELDKCD